jgi:hypothetical protein
VSIPLWDGVFLETAASLAWEKLRVAAMVILVWLVLAVGVAVVLALRPARRSVVSVVFAKVLASTKASMTLTSLVVMVATVVIGLVGGFLVNTLSIRGMLRLWGW